MVTSVGAWPHQVPEANETSHAESHQDTGQIGVVAVSGAGGALGSKTQCDVCCPGCERDKWSPFLRTMSLAHTAACSRVRSACWVCIQKNLLQEKSLQFFSRTNSQNNCLHFETKGEKPFTTLQSLFSGSKFLSVTTLFLFF